MSDPVHKNPVDGKWYYYDETWAYREGPYDSREEAAASLDFYCKIILNGGNPVNEYEKIRRSLLRWFIGIAIGGAIIGAGITYYAVKLY